jgi:hypothetical protein
VKSSVDISISEMFHDAYKLVCSKLCVHCVRSET